MKAIKKLAVFSTVGVLSMTSLTSCLGKINTEEEPNQPPQTKEEMFMENTALEQLQEEAKDGEKRAFEPYQHLFFIRVDLLLDSSESHAENLKSGSINIPEGYKVFDIENFSERDGYGSQTRGYDIWFTNEVPVEVTATYNESYEKYDYSHFGIPVVEKVNEEAIQKIK